MGKNGTIVPLPAVQRGPNGLFVDVVGSDDVARMRTATVRQSRDGEALVASGPKGDERVVTDGQSDPTNGAKVAVVTRRRRTRGAELDFGQRRAASVKLWSGFIRRHIATIMQMTAVGAGGMLGFQRSPVAALPTVDVPTIQVRASLPSADHGGSSRHAAETAVRSSSCSRAGCGRR